MKNLVQIDVNFGDTCSGGCQACILGNKTADKGTNESKEYNVELIKKILSLDEFAGRDIDLCVGGEVDSKNGQNIKKLPLKKIRMNVKDPQKEGSKGEIENFIHNLSSEISITLCLEQSKKEENFELSLSGLPEMIDFTISMLRYRSKVGILLGVNDVRPGTESEKWKQRYENVQRQIQNIANPDGEDITSTVDKKYMRGLEKMQFIGHMTDDYSSTRAQFFTHPEFPESEIFLATSVREFRGTPFTISEVLGITKSGVCDDYLGYFSKDMINPFHSTGTPMTKLSPFWLSPELMGHIIDRGRMIGYRAAKVEYLERLLS